MRPQTTTCLLICCRSVLLFCCQPGPNIKHKKQNRMHSKKESIPQHPHLFAFAFGAFWLFVTGCVCFGFLLLPLGGGVLFIGCCCGRGCFFPCWCGRGGGGGVLSKASPVHPPRPHQQESHHSSGNSNKAPTPTATAKEILPAAIAKQQPAGSHSKKAAKETINPKP